MLTDLLIRNYDQQTEPVSDTNCNQSCYRKSSILDTAPFTEVKSATYEYYERE